MIDCYGSLIHMVDHIAPIYNALPEGMKGRFYSSNKMVQAQAALYGITCQNLQSSRPIGTSPIMVASIGDVRHCGPTKRPVILVEHGIGLHFTGPHVTNHPSYPGGTGIRLQVELILSTNQQAADEELAVNKGNHRRVVVVGAPKLDAFANLPPSTNTSPILSYATHWDCHCCPETRSAFYHYKDILNIISKIYPTLGHAHPRWKELIYSRYSKLGMSPQKRFTSILTKADLLMGDCGSAIYEFAYTNKPVVVLNCPLYRRNFRHGLRFWDYIPGIQCNDPDDLLSCVETALADPPNLKLLRQQAIDYAYPNRGCATQVAIKAILDWSSDNGY